MSNTNTINRVTDFLNGNYTSYDNTLQEGEEIVEFCCNPLLSIYLHTELGSTKDHVCYDEVFENWEELTSFMPTKEFSEAEKFVNNIIEYYKEELAWKRVLGNSLFTEWEKELKLFLDLADQNCCKKKHVAMFCKLPQFYKTAIEFDTNYTKYNCKGFKVPEENFYCQSNPKWKYLWNTKKHTKLDKKHTFYYFVDDKNRLYEFKTKENSALNSMIENFWPDQYVEVQTSTKVKSKYSTGATYYYCEYFKI